MKQQFFVGDKVRVCNTPQKDTDTPMDWNSDMDSLCGEVGIVNFKQNYGNDNDKVGYCVGFESGISWYFVPEWLTIVERAWQKNTGEQPVDGCVRAIHASGRESIGPASMKVWEIKDGEDNVVSWRLPDSPIPEEVKERWRREMDAAQKLCNLIFPEDAEDCVEAIPPSHVALGDNLVQVGEPCMKIWCDTCQGTGEIDETLGGESFSSRDTPCPDCDGKGWWERAIAASVDNVRAQQDFVNSPKHYAFFDGVEAIEIIASSMSVEAFRGYCMGNALKYRLRVGKKDKVEQEIAKADKYGELFEKHKHLCKGEAK